MSSTNACFHGLQSTPLRIQKQSRFVSNSHDGRQLAEIPAKAGTAQIWIYLLFRVYVMCLSIS